MTVLSKYTYMHIFHLPSSNSILRIRKEPFYQSIGEKSYRSNQK